MLIVLILFLIMLVFSISMILYYGYIRAGWRPTSQQNPAPSRVNDPQLIWSNNIDSSSATLLSSSSIPTGCSLYQFSSIRKDKPDYILDANSNYMDLVNNPQRKVICPAGGTAPICPYINSTTGIYINGTHAIKYVYGNLLAMNNISRSCQINCEVDGLNLIAGCIGTDGIRYCANNTDQAVARFNVSNTETNAYVPCNGSFPDGTQEFNYNLSNIIGHISLRGVNVINGSIGFTDYYGTQTNVPPFGKTFTPEMSFMTTRYIGSVMNGYTGAISLTSYDATDPNQIYIINRGWVTFDGTKQNFVKSELGPAVQIQQVSTTSGTSNDTDIVYYLGYDDSDFLFLRPGFFPNPINRNWQLIPPINSRYLPVPSVTGPTGPSGCQYSIPSYQKIAMPRTSIQNPIPKFFTDYGDYASSTIQYSVLYITPENTIGSRMLEHKSTPGLIPNPDDLGNITSYSIDMTDFNSILQHQIIEDRIFDNYKEPFNINENIIQFSAPFFNWSMTSLFCPVKSND